MESLLLVNPRRKRRKRSSRRRQPAALRNYWASRRAGKRRTRLANPRRRKRRKHPVSAAHPRRPVRHAIGRRYHRNPRRRRSGARLGFSVSSGRGLLKTLVIPGATGAGGALALDVVMGYASPYLPASLQSGWLNTAVKGVAAIGVGMLAGKVLGKERGRVVTLGGLTVVLYNALKPMLVGKIPGMAGYSDYTPYRMGAYMPGPTGTPGIRGLGYVSPAPTLSPRMGAYMPMNVAPTMGDYGDGM